MFVVIIFRMYEVCECMCAHTVECMWKSVDKFQESALSFHDMYQTLNSVHQAYAWQAFLATSPPVFM